jgi:tetratricopeptide (TPR) repeat protein
MWYIQQFTGYQSYINLFINGNPMDICEKYLDDARKALKGSMFSKPNPTEAVRSYEGAAQCFENYRNFERAAKCYVETANLIARTDPLKAAEVLQKAGTCMEKIRAPSDEYYLQAASIYKDHAVALYRTNPEQGLQLLQKAAESFEKGGDRDSAIQCYDVGAEASLKRKDYLNALVFYGTAGQSFERHKEYKKAVKYFHKVAKIWDIQHVPANVAENYTRMASSLETLKEYEYASQFYMKAGEKYEEAQEIYKSAKSYEKGAEILGSAEKFGKAAEFYSKAAELIKSLKNMDKFEELYTKAAECYGKCGDHKKSVEIALVLADTFCDDPYRCSNHFEKAISFAGDNQELRADLMQKQGKALLQARDFLKAAQSYQGAAEIAERLGTPFKPIYKDAGGAWVQFAEGMVRVKNEAKAKEGYDKAISCFEKADMPEEVEKIRQEMEPEVGEREKQVLDELNRLKEDFEKGLLLNRHYQQMREGYQELLKRLRQ